MATRSGKTKSGFEFEIDEEIFDDWKIFKAIGAVNDGDRLAYRTIIRDTLGQEQAAELEKHCTGENGRVSTAKMISEINEIYEISAKNS